jgi:hypothetical protein
LQQAYPSLWNIVENTVIPLEQSSDELLWSQADYGQLSLKSPYAHFNPPGNNIFWAKLVWNISIPPGNNIMMWRFMHNKLPTDDNLMLRLLYALYM